MNGRPWTKGDDARMRALYPAHNMPALVSALGRTAAAIYGRADKLGLKKTAAYLASPSACRLRRGDNPGVAHRFPKGHVPANKGLRRPGWHRGRMRETWFKKGQVSKRWDPEVFIIGALRINSDGYLEIKTRMGSRSWDPMARFVWQTERGDIPPGMAVRAINGDPDDTRIENLRLVSRAELMRENTIHRLPKPLADTIRLRGVLIRVINRKERKRAEQHP